METKNIPQGDLSQRSQGGSATGQNVIFVTNAPSGQQTAANVQAVQAPIAAAAAPQSSGGQSK